MDFDPRDIDARERDDLPVHEVRWNDDPRDQDDRERDVDRDRDARDRDPREPFIASLELPRCPERELVRDERENLYELNRDDSLMLGTIGAFRVVAERELQHDSDVFRVYRQIEGEIRERGGEVERVVLEVDLRREYQQWLQEHNRGRSESDGRPDRTEREIAQWAAEHDLRYIDDKVNFPDLRIEYELDGRDRHEHVEVVS